MLRVGFLVFTICLILNSLLVQGTRADRSPDFDYDIFTRDDSLAFWLDLTPVFNQTKSEDLISGLDIYININIKVEKPHTLFLSKKLAEIDIPILISHPLTEDIYRLKISRKEITAISFENQMLLSDYLADSLFFKIYPTGDIDTAARIRLQLKISCKSFTNSVLPFKSGSPENEFTGSDTSRSEFFTEIFSFFFDLIGYGVDNYKLTSPVFRIEELPALD